MYRYQNSIAQKKQESVVPKRASEMYLTDNRAKNVVQRVQQTSIDNRGVIQLGKFKKVTDRPSFTADSKKSAILHHNTSRHQTFKINLKKPGLDKLNAAQPHRLSWKDIRENTMKYHNNISTSGFDSFTAIFIKSGNSRIRRINRRLQRAILQKSSSTRIAALTELLKRAKGSQTNFEQALTDYKSKKNDSTLKEFLRQANSFHANVPDYGPHMGVNNPVRAAIHLNLRKSRKTRHRDGSKDRARSPSPMSRRLLKGMAAKHLSDGIPVDHKGRIITTSGETVRISSLSKKMQKQVGKIKKKHIDSFQKNAQFGPSS
ncbi:hypothetical protein [Kordia zhangzhouensis]|uniref:hypothetical protein n=1 Tax=Kordia zhangzhouensis TaxID=1620405 RepID=UPI0006297D98|nr:hypothetical protein [Kordia zhangzhouensis]